MHDLIAIELHKLLEEVRKESRRQSELLERILCELKHPKHAPNRKVLGGVMSQKGPNMVSITPGNNPTLGVTPLPTGVVTVDTQTKWTLVASDPSITLTPIAADGTGLTAVLGLPTGLATPFNGTITWEYTNTAADGGSTVTCSATFSDNQPPPVVTAVASASMEQIG